MDAKRRVNLLCVFRRTIMRSSRVSWQNRSLGRRWYPLELTGAQPLHDSEWICIKRDELQHVRNETIANHLPYRYTFDVNHQLFIPPHLNMNLKLCFLHLPLAVCLGATAATLPHDPGLTSATIGSPSGSPSTGLVDVNNSTAFALMVCILLPSLGIANADVRLMQYGYPLVLYVQTFEGTLRAVDTNALQHEEGLSAENAEVLVRPNVDTLYSRAAIDLSHVDVVISIPETLVDRYHVLPFYDL